jgi:hypothetical protein
MTSLVSAKGEEGKKAGEARLFPFLSSTKSAVIPNEVRNPDSVIT